MLRQAGTRPPPDESAPISAKQTRRRIPPVSYPSWRLAACSANLAGAMRFDACPHHRRSVRLPTFDYRSAGAYFVTVCTHERAIIFDDMRTRRPVQLALLSVGRYCRPASVDEFVVMPNHVHAIIWIAGSESAGVRGVGAQHTPRPERPSPADGGLLARRHDDPPCAAPLP